MQQQHYSLEEPPRSPKITYSTPSPTSSKMACVADMPGNTSPSSGYFEQRSPKYLSHQSSPRKFVFDAVSPRHESIGECIFFFSETVHTNFNNTTTQKKNERKKLSLVV